MVVLYLRVPATAFAGRCAVVPTGTIIPAVPEEALIALLESVVMVTVPLPPLKISITIP